MSVHAGPNIIENGLVLSLDASNEKSFKGEPTTNDVLIVGWGGDGSPTIATVNETSLMYKGYPTQSIIGGTSNNCYLHAGDLSSTTSTEWTFSCYLRREDRLPITSMSVYMYYPSSDGASSATIQDVGNGWYRLYRTRTGTAAAITLAGFTGLVSGVRYYLSGAQLEKKTYPTNYVLTNTTRGTTVATGGGLEDLSGNGNNGALTGLTFNSNNKGSLAYLPASSTQITFDNNSNLQMLGTQPYTLEAWVYPTINPGINKWTGIFDRESNSGSGRDGYNLYFLGSATTNTFFATERFSAGVASNVSITVDSSSSVNQWNHIVAAYDGTTLRLYRNGQLASSGSSTLSISNNIKSLTVGVRGGQRFTGNIGPTNIYTAALTASQVIQNFNALRGRYGI